MKTIVKISSLFLASILIFSCGVQNNSTSSRMHLKSDHETAKDSVEYEIIIFDVQFDRWLMTQPMNNEAFYSNDYLISMNAQYADAWNRLYATGDKRVQSYIDYDRRIDYGKELNFKLFMYFKYFQERYKINLLMI